MIPVLYVANETNFNHNGVGVLSDCVSCVVTEERNGVYECEFSYPITGAFYSEISPDRIVKVKASEYADGQLFRIYRSSKPINGIVKFYCQHISYDLNTNIVNPFKAESVNAVTALTRVLENCYYQHSFTATSTNGTTSTIDIKVPTPARSCLGGMKGSILDNFGGEYEFDNFTIKLHGSRGQDNGVTILYGKNLTAIKADTNLQNTYTAVYPYATDTDGNTTVLTEKVIETDTFNSFGEPKVLALDLSDKFTEQEITEAKIRQYANSYITQNKIQDIYQNIEISFVQLWQTEEYKNISLLERVGLCDIVTVKYPALGVSVKAKVVKTVYDALKEKYQKIELGKVRSDFGASLKKLGEQVKEASELNKSAMQRAIENATKLITGQDGGYVVMNATADGHPYEILIMNTDNIQTATKLWRWNLGGLGYSSTGYNGPYGTAITMDGAIVADYITTGTLNAGLIKAGIIEDEAHKNYWNMISGEFKLSNGTSDAIKYESGVLSINADFVTGGVLQDTNGVNYWNMTSGEFKLSNGTSDAIKYENGTLTMNASFITTGTLDATRIRAGILQDANSTNYWNLDTGEFRLSANTKVGSSASSPTLSNYVATTADTSVLTQQKVFNALTNNGQTMGIFLNSADNKLYINASYISTGYISANIINSGTMSADRIKTGKITSEDGYATFDLDNGRIALSQRQSSATTGSIRLSTGGITLLDPSDTYLGSWQVGTETSGGSVSYKSSMVTNWLTVDTLTVNDKINSFSTPVLTATTRVESPVIQANTSLYAQEISSPRAILSSLYVQGASPKLYFDGKQLSYVQTTVNGEQWLLVGYPVSGYTPSVTTDINLANTYYDTDHSGAAKKGFTELSITSTDGKTYNVAAYNLNSSSSASTHIEDVSLNSHALGISDTVTYGGTSYKLLTYNNNRYQSLNPNATRLYYNGHTFSPVAVKIGPITFTLLGYEVT